MNCTAGSEYECYSAGELERRLHTKLMPEACSPRTANDRFVVRSRSDASLVGAGAIVYHAVVTDPVLAGSDMCFVSTDESLVAGGARTLVEQMLQYATLSGAAGIASIRFCGSSDPATAAWRSVGANAVRGATLYRSPLSAIFRTCEPIDKRLRQRGTTIFDCRSLSEFDPEEIVPIYQQGFGLHRSEAIRRFDADESSGFLYETSRVAVLDGRIIGLLLLRRGERQDIAVIDAITVVPEYRGSPANLMLMLAAARAGRSWCNEIEFLAHERHTSTLKFAQRSGAEAIDVRYRYRLTAKDWRTKSNDG